MDKNKSRLLGSLLDAVRRDSVDDLIKIFLDLDEKTRADYKKYVDIWCDIYSSNKVKLFISGKKIF